MIYTRKQAREIQRTGKYAEGRGYLIQNIMKGVADEHVSLFRDNPERKQEIKEQMSENVLTYSKWTRHMEDRIIEGNHPEKLSQLEKAEDGYEVFDTLHDVWFEENEV